MFLTASSLARTCMVVLFRLSQNDRTKEENVGLEIGFHIFGRKETNRIITEKG
jgi:hypothetical protein